MNALKQNLFKAIDFLLRVEQGPDAGKAYKIQPPQISIGRDPRCQITLTDPKVSRKQCVIKFSNNVICEDHSTRKNTLINGKPCGKTVLRPGDKISFRQTVMVFQTRTNENAQAQLPGTSAPPSPEQLEKKKGRKNFNLFLGVLVVMVFSVFLLEEPAKGPPEEKLATTADLKKQVEESEERMSLIRENRAEQRKLNNKDYLYNVENHFIAGFRDYQNGQYGRAVDSFGTTIGVDQSHVRAQLYRKTAMKKRADLIDTHLRDGQKYKDKMMYNRCAAEFEKALILINKKDSKRYELARSQLEECRWLKTGGYQ